MGILFIDLDRFKDVNDTMGHHAGDDLLGQVTSRLCSALRATATLARIGGDEFVVLVPEIYGVADAIALATRIRACLTEPFAIEDRPVVMTCSVGVAVGHGHEADFESLLQRADGAMYDAKGLGRDTFVVDSPALTETWRRRVAMSSDLHHAIDRNELTISYQPQIRLDTGGSSESKPSFDGSTPRSARSAPMSSWSSTGGSGGLRSRRFDRGSTQVWNPSGSRSTSRRVTYAIRTFQRS